MKEWIDFEDFDFSILNDIKIQKRKRGNPAAANRQQRYKDVVCAFDIETSKIPFIDHSAMYIWMFQIGLGLPCIIGRDWESFQQLVEELGKTINKEAHEKYVVYVHNLSYEFQFLSGIYPFRPDEVFAIKSRKVAKCYMCDTVEFRCSYFHSNMSLAKFTENMKVEHVKQDSEEYNHALYRTPETILSEKEIRYAVHDVKGLVECIYKELEKDGDTLYTIPLTSTGYVRRDTKRAMRHTPAGYVDMQLPNLEVYKLLREAFRGGNTHANRYYTGAILHDVKSADYASSYPAVQINCEFPVTRFVRIESRPDVIMRRMILFGRAILTRLHLTAPRLKDKYWGCPYIPRDKCRNIHKADIDNGRVLSADYLEITVTDLDLKIILEEYDYDAIAFSDSYQAKYGKLPPAYIENVISYFRAKTELKGIEEKEYEYMKSKNKINAIYGMSAQDPVKRSFIYYNAICEGMEKYEPFVEDMETPIKELLEHYNDKAFLPYQWGVWTTAWARYRLEQAIKLCGDSFVYADTDSVKYLDNIEEKIAVFNRDRMAESKENGGFAEDAKGKVHYIGVLEQERTYANFKTLGAKKYAYQYSDGKFHITVAGVHKTKGAEELQQAAEEQGKSPLELFEEDFLFTAGGGTESVYNDTAFGVVNINGHDRFVGRNIYIRPSTYTVSLGKDYRELLARASLRSIGEALRKAYNVEDEINDE